MSTAKHKFILVISIIGCIFNSGLIKVNTYPPITPHGKTHCKDSISDITTPYNVRLSDDNTKITQKNGKTSTTTIYFDTRDDLQCISFNIDVSACKKEIKKQNISFKFISLINMKNHIKLNLKMNYFKMYKVHSKQGIKESNLNDFIARWKNDYLYDFRLYYDRVKGSMWF